jgi:hypothetical protein
MRQLRRTRSHLILQRQPMKIDLETILLDLHALALSAHEAGFCVIWYEPNELRGLDPDTVQNVMTLAANEFIESNATLPARQLSLDLDMPSDDRS